MNSAIPGLHTFPQAVTLSSGTAEVVINSAIVSTIVIYIKKAFKDDNYTFISEKLFDIANELRKKLQHLLPKKRIEIKSTNSIPMENNDELHLVLEIESNSQVYEQQFAEILSKTSPVFNSNQQLFQQRQSQSYILKVGTSISITGFGPSGLFFGSSSLLQLFKFQLHHSEKIYLHGMVIHDFPQFVHRGVMLDISRDKVPTMDTLYLLIDQLSSWKINQIQLYMEHTYAYEGHEQVWKNASPMTSQELLELDHFCRERFIQLVPNQNSFGHMHRWLVHEKYRDLSEVPEGFNHGFSKTPEPFTLCPTDPKVFTFIEDLFDQLLPNFSSREINVGMDETFDLGQGRSKTECEKIGLGTVYANYLKKVYTLAKERGFRMQFWGDIILNHEAVIKDLPQDLVALIWGYEGTHPFEKQCQAFLKHNIPFYVCPGTSSWNSIVGRTDNCIENLKNAAMNGARYGAEGYLITDWGDHGHFQPFSTSLLGFFVGSALSWNAASQTDEQLLTNYLNADVFEDKEDNIGTIVYALGNLYSLTGEHVHSNGTLFGRLPAFPDITIPPTVSADKLTNTLPKIRYLRDMLDNTKLQCPDATQIKKELQIACDMILFAAKLAIQRVTNNASTKGIPKGERIKLSEELAAIIQEYSKSWLSRNRLGGLSDSMARLQDTLKLLSE